MPWHWTPTRQTLFCKRPLPSSRSAAVYVYASNCGTQHAHFLRPTPTPTSLHCHSLALWRARILFMQSMHQRMHRTSSQKPPLLAHLQSLTSGIDYR